MKRVELQPFIPEEDFSGYFGIRFVRAFLDGNTLAVDVGCEKDGGYPEFERVSMRLSMKEFVDELLKDDDCLHSIGDSRNLIELAEYFSAASAHLLKQARSAQ